VFCGLPLMYAQPSSSDATAMSVDGLTSDSFCAIARRRFASVSLSPSRTC
jgi:hypothetical protein